MVKMKKIAEVILNKIFKNEQDYLISMSILNF